MKERILYRFFVAVVGLCLIPVFALGESFELRFDHPRPVGAVKAWGDRICVYDSVHLQIGCYDRGGRELFSTDLRTTLPGVLNRFSAPVDYTILDDGGLAFVGLAPEGEAHQENEYAYVLGLDSTGRRNGISRISALVMPKALAGVRQSSLSVVGVPTQLAARLRGCCEGANGARSSSEASRQPVALLHRIDSLGRLLGSDYPIALPDDSQGLAELAATLNKGVAVDRLGNRFLFVDDNVVAAVSPSGAERRVALPLKSASLRIAIGLRPQWGEGALAIVVEGDNEAGETRAAEGFFAMTSPRQRVFSIDPSGHTSEIPGLEDLELVGQLSDGVLVGLKGAGRGRSEVLFVR